MKRHQWQWFYGVKDNGGEMRRCRRCRAFWVTKTYTWPAETERWYRRDDENSWSEIKPDCEPAQ